jgi:hypothetical protein
MKSSIFIISFLLCYGISAQKGDPQQCRWHTVGKIEASEYQLVRKAKLQYFLSNDDDYLYIDLKADNREIQDRILTEGMTIWINMDGSEARKLGVRFPLGSKNQGGRRKADSHENNSIPEANQVNPVLLANTIELKGFTNEVQRHFPANNNDNFRGSVRYDEAGILYYELVMPLGKLPVRNSREGHGAMPFNLGIEYGSLSLSNNQDINRGPKPASLFRSDGAGSGNTVLQWIKNVRLATSK